MEKVEFDALIDQIKGQLPEAVAKIIAEKGLKMEDVENALTEKTISKSDFEEFKTIMNNAVVELKNERAKVVVVKTAAEEIKEQKETLKSIGKGGREEIELKALTTRASIDGNAHAFDLPEIGQLSTRELSMEQIFPTITVGESNNNGVIRYIDWDEDTIARAAAAVAEGAAFPESTAKMKKYQLDLKKIGDTLTVTEEFFEDEQMAAAELQMFLQTNVALEIDEEIALGDGTGNHLTGLVASVPEYTLPAAGDVQDGNIFDLIVKVKGQITTGGGSKFKPDVCLVPFGTKSKMLAKKDLNNNYVVPSFVTISGNSIVVDGLQVIETNILEGEVAMVIGDRRFGKIYAKSGVMISEGRVNAQFVEDELTLKARKRLLFLIRNCDKKGFRKVTDLDAALTAITE